MAPQRGPLYFFNSLPEDRTDMNIPEEEYRRIEQQIFSETSPVGIDAKKTHVIILYKLGEIERRLEKIEESLEAGSV